MLRVSDTGVGISADDLKRIGDPFFQAGKTYQRRHEGTGLGLSIVKSLVALHAGEMIGAEQARRRHHRDRRIAAGLHAEGRAARQQYRNAHSGGAIRHPGAIPSGEEKCLEISVTMTTCRAAVAARGRLPWKRRPSGALRCASCCTARRTLVAGLLAFAAVSAIIANALFLQAGRHPSPMFGTVTRMPAAAMTPASPLPRPRPADAAARPADPQPSEPRVVEPRSADPKSDPGAIPRAIP